MRAVVMGGTGLVGSALLRELERDAAWSDVAAHARRRGEPLRKVRWLGLDEVVRPADVGFCCLGTTIKVAGSQDAFRKVDHALVVRFAKDCKLAGVRSFHVVSAVGADAASRTFYLRTKGEMERDVAAVGIPMTCAYRPSFLLGERSESRPGERFGIAAARVLGSVIPKKLRGVPADAVARAMVAHAKAPGHAGFAAHANDVILSLGQTATAV